MRLPTGDRPALAVIQRATLDFPSPVLKAAPALASLFVSNPQVWALSTTTTTL